MNKSDWLRIGRFLIGDTSVFNPASTDAEAKSAEVDLAAKRAELEAILRDPNQQNLHDRAQATIADIDNFLKEK